MGIGTSIFLIAVGAILRYAVTVTTQGVNLHAVGDILMIVGLIGIVLSLIFWSSWGGFGGGGRARRYDRTVVDRDPDVYRRSTVVDRDPGVYRRSTVVERDSEVY
jgi:hypothetical protein